MSKFLRILLIEDSPDDSELIARQLRKAGYQLHMRRAEAREEMQEALKSECWDVILSDYNLPQFSAIGALDEMRLSRLDLPFIIVSRAIGEETAVELMKAGAHDYVLKDHLARLVPAIEREIKEALIRKERAQTEREKNRLLDELREAVRARDEFLSVASHELKTPITPLKLQVQMLRRVIVQGGHIEVGKLEDVLSGADRSILRLSRLVDELLDVSRISTGKLTLIREPMSLVDLARELVDTLVESGDAGPSGINIRARAYPSGYWDRVRLEQVISNLITNAIRYGGGRPIDIEIDVDEAAALMRVIDRGIGIDPKDHARIFQRFERASSSQNFGGLGLGLFIVRQIVELHGGIISVESQPGHGSVFTVRLPMRERTLAAVS